MGDVINRTTENEFMSMMCNLDVREQQIVVQTLPLSLLQDELIRRYNVMSNTLYANSYGYKVENK